MSEYCYDIAVIGGGPGGYIAAIRCAQYGKKVVLIEGRELGGTCLNRGCIPTKALLHSAEVYETALKSEEFGVATGEVSFDYSKVSARKDALVAKLRAGIAGLEKAHGVKVINGFGRVVNAHTILVNDDEVTFDKLILATGSAPSLPPISGINSENVVTSDEMLSATELKESYVIIGGGVIGIEFASLLSSFGKKVTVLEMLPSILPGVDSDIVRTLMRVLKKKKVTIVNNAKVTSIVSGQAIEVKYELDSIEKSAQGDCCIVAVGRKPQTMGIGLDAIGVEMDRAFVRINEQCQTNLNNVYAVGDITGKIQLAHVASAQGLVAAANACGKEEIMDYSVIPSCIYTAPEIAFIGMSEDKAKELGIEHSIGTFNVAGNGRAMIMNEAIGLVKVVSEASGKLIGAQMICPRATDMIAEIGALIKKGAYVSELAEIIHPHPSVSECVMEAAHDLEGLCCHALPKRK